MPGAKRKRPKPSRAELEAVLDDPNRYHRIDAFLAYSYHKPNIECLPALRRALRDPEIGVANFAAMSIRKLGLNATAAVDDLVAAAGSPQRFEDSIAALVKIAPEDPRLLGIIRKTIPFSNYGVLKAALEALATIGSEDALNTIKWIDTYWGACPKDRIVDELINKIYDRCTGLAKAERGAAPEFVQHRDALFRRRADGSYRSTVYCRLCRGPMTSLKGVVPYRCRKCRLRVDFNACQLPEVMQEVGRV